ncbi:hypothetical protein AT15_00440 [Kosmotoga arenicorallina S304]|uniref:30S ribosomal protein S23 n=1 Tax=Kosmotoga arenicorallina S304 TaxID=1453497 RepID=A0A176K0X7_9BACT|nr:four helix bundle protein [Kosmotoga arenicorallina]OAA30176.1 hypothetical protein AT15_00440 [Kosmotoga arenicorallina S304]
MSFKELDLWEKSIELVTDIYSLTKKFPKSEIYGLTMQMRRAAVSIPSNIAEGNGRGSSKEFIQFLIVSRGSLTELMTQVEISKRLGFIPKDESKDLLEKMERIMMMLNKLITTLRSKLNS